MKGVKVGIDLRTIDRLRRVIQRRGNARRDGLGRVVWEAVELYLDRWNGPKRTRPPVPKVSQTDASAKGRPLTVKMCPADVIELRDLAKKLSKRGARKVRMEDLIVEAARMYASGVGVTAQERRIARDMVGWGIVSEAYNQWLRETGSRCRCCRR